MFGVREYVATTRSGQFNSLLTLDFPYVLTQSFAPLVKSIASERFTKNTSRWCPRTMPASARPRSYWTA
jgi:type IV secretory pathway VirB4 component